MNRITVFLFACTVACSSSQAAPAAQLAPGQLAAGNPVGAIQTDGQYVYYIDDARVVGGAIRLMRVPVTGGPADVLSSGGAWGGFAATYSRTLGCLLDAVALYCSDGAQIVSVPLQGGPPATLVPLSGVAISALAQDATTLYWLQETVGPLIDEVMAMPKSGGPSRSLASTNASPPGALAVVRGSLCWIAISNPTLSLLDDVIMCVPTNGGSASQIVGGQHEIVAVTTDPSENIMYWITLGNENLTTQRYDGALIQQLVAWPNSAATLVPNLPYGQNGPFGVPDPQLLRTTPGGAPVWRDLNGLHQASGGNTTSYVASDDVLSFAIDDAFIYWSNAAGIFASRL